MGLEAAFPVVLQVLAPVLANTANSLSAFFGSKKANGEDFSYKKLLRTAMSTFVASAGLVLLAWVLGKPATPETMDSLSLEYAGFVAGASTIVGNLVDNLLAKPFFRFLDGPLRA